MTDAPQLNAAESQIEPPAATAETIGAAPGKALSDAARRALQEAQARRADRAASALASTPDEIGGPAGPDPTRYGDWERKGVAIDF